MPTPILTYFQFRGLGEPIRLLFEDLDLPYEDRRIDLFSDAWPALSPQLPFRQLPRLEIDGQTLFQSHAILRYLARANGLAGETDAERLRCDVGVEAARDLQQRLWDHFWSPGSDTEAAAQAFAVGQLASELAKLNAWLGDAPYVGGARALFADYFVLTVVDEAGAFFPAALERAPALAAYRRRMHARPGIAAYAASGRQASGYGFDPARGIRSPTGLAPMEGVASP
jgi:glutathione S-transferase